MLRAKQRVGNAAFNTLLLPTVTFGLSEECGMRELGLFFKQSFWRNVTKIENEQEGERQRDVIASKGSPSQRIPHPPPYASGGRTP
mmetsp:Transcript_14599/g.25644  ORF Transcript_14599/g.25644 Transcript_14599/m.25644 type:complete len:86 (-) Transcript_14599:17-274(-)